MFSIYKIMFIFGIFMYIYFLNVYLCIFLKCYVYFYLYTIPLSSNCILSLLVHRRLLLKTELCPSKVHVDTVVPIVTIFGDGASREVIKVKCGHIGESNLLKLVS